MAAGEANGGELVGKVLGGRYRVTSVVGRGGMGVVARAVDDLLGREVAVKVLRAFTDTSDSELTDLRDRMRREAQAAARIRHGGVVTVHDVTEDQGLPVLVMELVDGPSLDDVLKERGTLEPREAADVGAKLMDALDAAHRVGVLHRDVKPGNVLLERGGRVVLTDFGIASMGATGDEALTKLTRSGDLVGSLDFLPPERAQGRDPGPASDIWSLGMTLYAAVEGTWPFRRTSVWSTLAAIVTEPLPEPSRAGPLTSVLHALMAKDPDSRPDAARARELLEEVAGGGAPRPAVPPSRVAPPEAPDAPAAPTTPAPPAPGPATPAGTPSAPAFGPATPAFGPAAQPFGPPPGPPPGTPTPYGPAPVPAPVPVPGSASGPGLASASASESAPAYGHGPEGPAGAANGGAASGSESASGSRSSGRAGGRGRGRALVAAAVAAVLLAGGGVTYALTGADSEGSGRSDEAARTEPATTPSPTASAEPGGHKKEAPRTTPSASPSRDSHGEPSSTPEQRPGRAGTAGEGSGERDREGGPAQKGEGSGSSGPITPTPKPGSPSESCGGWTHQNPRPGTYAFMSGSYHIMSGPYMTCSVVTLATSGTKLWFHCSVVNARGNNWTHVRIAGTHTEGWMSNDNVTRQSGASTRC